MVSSPLLCTVTIPCDKLRAPRTVGLSWVLLTFYSNVTEGVVVCCGHGVGVRSEPLYPESRFRIKSQREGRRGLRRPIRPWLRGDTRGVRVIHFGSTMIPLLTPCPTLPYPTLSYPTLLSPPYPTHLVHPILFYVTLSYNLTSFLFQCLRPGLLRGRGIVGTFFHKDVPLHMFLQMISLVDLCGIYGGWSPDDVFRAP